MLPVTLGEADPVPDNLTDDILWLVSNRSFANFRAIVVAAPARADRLALPAYAALTLQVVDGDFVRAVPLSPKDR